MKALTLKRPWAWAICHAGKRVENRTWRPPADILRGEVFAIHAGKGWDEEGFRYQLGEHVAQHMPSDSRDPQGIVAVCRCEGIVASEQGLVQAGMGDQVKWFAGPVGWVLTDVRVLTNPVPCRGAQLLWTVPPDVLAKVMEGLL